MPEFIVKNNEDKDTVIRYDEADVCQVQRCDYAAGKVGKMSRTDEGYLKGSAAVAKVGVLQYIQPDGTIRRELVPAETLFNKDSMDTLKLQPVTDRHPPEVLLDKRTVKRRKVGSTGEVIREDNSFLVTSLVITDEDSIEEVLSGREQLSPGYKVDLVMQSGVFNGERYDAVQINRKYNHVAICDRARGGADLKINLDHVTDLERVDGYDIKMDSGSNILQKVEKEQSMPKFNINGIDYDAAQEVINHITSLQAKNDELSATVETVKNEGTKLQAKLDSAEEKITSLEKQDSTEEINAAVKARLDLIKIANLALDEEELKKIDSMSNEELQRAVILKKQPNAKLDEKDSIYVQARFDSVVEGLEFDPSAAANNRVKSGRRFDGEQKDDIVEKARKDSEERILNGWSNIPDQYK